MSTIKIEENVYFCKPPQLVYDPTMTKAEPSISLKALDWALERKGWNAAKLAQETGVSTAVFSLLNQGKRTGMSSANLAKIAVALDVSMDFLMGLTENPERRSGQDVNMAIVEIVAIAKTLPNLRQRDLLMTARGYADTAEETKRQLLQDMRDLIFEVADSSGRGEELNEYLKQLIDRLESGQQPPKAENEDEAGGTDEPPQK